eukprot:scaffold24329_cov101-Isochrysis_galbana.AAC.5
MPEDREPNAPDMPHADTRTPLHGPTGGVPSDKALSLSDTTSPFENLLGGGLRLEPTRTHTT